MSSPNLKAIRDWCVGKFQAKGNYLTSVPDGYVTSEELEAKNYATKDEIPSNTTGVTTEEVKGLINTSFSENMSGAKIAQDAEGNWGLITPGADTVIPFSSGGGNGEVILPDIINYTYSNSGSSIVNVYLKNFYNNEDGYKKLRIVGTYGVKQTNSGYVAYGYMYINGYLKNEDGSVGEAKSIEVLKVTGNTTSFKYEDFDIEVNYDEFWFPNAPVADISKILSIKAGIQRSYIDVSITKLILSK